MYAFYKVFASSFLTKIQQNISISTRNIAVRRSRYTATVIKVPASDMTGQGL